MENFFYYAEVGKNFFEKISYLEEENKRHFLLIISQIHCGKLCGKLVENLWKS